MKPAQDELDRLERWMQSVITHPAGIAAGIASSEARRQVEVSASDLERVVRSTEQFGGLERLAVYGNAYFARLQDCLRAEFPAVRQGVGDEAFSAFVFGYLQRFPPASYTLADLGKEFPRYLEDTRPVESTSGAGAGWSRFVVELAQIERAYSEIFDGPGPERSAVLTHENLAGIDPQRWFASRLVPVECLRLFVLEFPVHEYISAVRRDGNPEVPVPATTHLAVFRREYVVRRLSLSPPEFAILSAFQQGMTVGEALSEALAAEETDSEVLAAELHGWFRDWTAAGLFAGVETD